MHLQFQGVEHICSIRGGFHSFGRNEEKGGRKVTVCSESENKKLLLFQISRWRNGVRKHLLFSFHLKQFTVE